MDLATFRAQHPEFDMTADSAVEIALDDAATQMDPDVYRTKYDMAHGLLTAHILATSPLGFSARLGDAMGDTSIYWPEFVKIRRMVAPRFMVL